ncbi:MAG: hypothetical protein ACOY0R_14130 [Chloroflexota bacterium]
MKLAQTIIIEVKPDYFVFINDDVKYVFETCIHYTLRDGEPVPVSIGESEGTPDTQALRLFDPESGVEIDKFGFLRLFLEYGIGRTFEKGRFPALKPVIVFRGAETLKKPLFGYHYGILHQAGLLAGAREVRFE